MESPRPVIAGRYEITATIAHGGMATVHRAHDRQLQRDVAIKRLRPEYGSEAAFTDRFTREARRMASLEHAGIVSVTDFGQDDDGHYLVMELVEGTDLAAVIRADAPLAPDRAAAIAIQIAEALAVAHRNGIVHRDIKPANVLVADGDAVKVTDFGIARAMAETHVTGTGVTLGSVHYFSPEQTLGAEVTPQSDVYALGIVLYEMLAGRRPFGGESPAAVAISRLSAVPPPPSAIQRGVPRALDAVVMRALEREPADRWPSAEAMRDALVRWRTRRRRRAAATAAPATLQPAADETAPIAATPPPASEQPARGRRWRVLAGLMAVIVLAGFVGQRLLADQPIVPAGIGGAVTPIAPKEAAGIARADPTPTPTPSPVPSPTSTPPPAVTPQPVVETPPPPAPPPAVPVVATDPSGIVAAFYSAVERQAFDEAYDLWSQRMRDSFPRQTNLEGRWDRTTGVAIERLDLLSQSASAAVVGVRFTETFADGSQQVLDGSWELVSVDGRWLLDWPHF